MIEFRVIDSAEVYRSTMPETRQLFEDVFQRTFLSDIWEQWYFSNPFGDPLVVLGYIGSKAVAHQAFIPQQLTNAAGAQLPYMLSISSMVERESRSWTVFNEMMKLLHESAARRGYGTTLVLPNSTASDLYRVLFRYRILRQTPLCTWTAISRPIEERGNSPALDGNSNQTFSYPSDARYWEWRTSLNKARVMDLDDSSKVVVKQSDDGVLTVLDVLMNSSSNGGERFRTLALSLGARAVRLTTFHANVLGVPEDALVPHEGYIARLMARTTCGETPDVHFSLLLSDAF